MLGVVGGPVDAQPRGLLWLVLSGVGMIVAMMIGYLASFASLGIVLKRCYGWTWKRVGELLFESRLPPHWASVPGGATLSTVDPSEAAVRARFVANCMCSDFACVRGSRSWP